VKLQVQVKEKEEIIKNLKAEVIELEKVKKNCYKLLNEINFE
jgi:hypothetical protein